MVHSRRKKSHLKPVNTECIDYLCFCYSLIAYMEMGSELGLFKEGRFQTVSVLCHEVEGSTSFVYRLVVSSNLSSVSTQELAALW